MVSTWVSTPNSVVFVPIATCDYLVNLPWSPPPVSGLPSGLQLHLPETTPSGQLLWSLLTTYSASSLASQSLHLCMTVMWSQPHPPPVITSGCFGISLLALTQQNPVQSTSAQSVRAMSTLCRHTFWLVVALNDFRAVFPC